MRRIIVAEKLSDTVCLGDISTCDAIFAKEHGKLRGMIVHEDRGWITRIGGDFGSNGHHSSLEKCIQAGIRTGYGYYIED